MLYAFTPPQKETLPVKKYPNMKKGRFHVRREQPYICTNELTLPVVTPGFVKASIGFGHPHGSELRLTFLLSNKFPQTFGV